MAQRIPADVRKRIDSIYVADEDRWVATISVGYSMDDLNNDENPGFADLSDEAKAKVAAHWALRLLSDEGSSGTQWQVIDRPNGAIYWFEQAEFEEDDAVDGDG